MEQEKINIAALLKDCPKGTKLYSPAYGEVELLKETIDIPIMVADKYGNKFSFNYYGGISLHGECLLFPSKEVRDWGRFRVKYIWGGDGILNGARVKKALLDNGGTDLSDGVWACGDPMALYYINAITHEICVAHTESEKEYILSTGTELKLEEEHPKFKVGDVVATKVHTVIGMVERLVCEGAFINYSGESTTTCRIDEIRLATSEEIDEWNKETLELNHLHYSKSKRKIIHWFLPFDKIAGRDDEGWYCDLFSHYKGGTNEEYPYCGMGGADYHICLPYNENTAKLIGTTDDYEEE